MSRNARTDGFLAGCFEFLATFSKKTLISYFYFLFFREKLEKTQKDKPKILIISHIHLTSDISKNSKKVKAQLKHPYPSALEALGFRV